MSKRFNNDRELLEACFVKDRGAMEEFVRNFSKLVYYSIHRAFKLKEITPQPEEVEDLFGDVFVSLFESDFARLRSFEGRNDCTLASWIRLIAGRRSIDYLRERSRNRIFATPDGELSTEAFTTDENPEKELIGKDQLKIVTEIIPNLGPDELLFLSLYYDRELPPQKIAEILGVSIGTVYSKKHRLHEKLQSLAQNVRTKKE